MFSYGIRKLPFFHLLKYIHNICESFLGSLGMCVIGKGERRCFKGIDGNSVANENLGFVFQLSYLLSV